MHHISSYLYDNRISVLLLDEDPNLKTRYRNVYSRTVKAHSGVDNVITIVFKNSDQKSANIAGKSFTFKLSSNIGNTAIWSSPVTISNATMAVGTVTIDRANIANLTQEFYTYSISYTLGNLTLPTYVDDNWGGAGQFQIINGAF